MIDLHAHVLPGVDDGAPDWETSLAMLALAEAGGSEAISVLTHVCPGPSRGRRCRRLWLAATSCSYAYSVRWVTR